MKQRHSTNANRPRIVIVTRKTSLELLIERHGTIGQSRFYLESRGQQIRDYQIAHERFASGLASVQSAIPADQRRTRIDRSDLDRFVFNDDDIVLIVGQDGLVPNAAKYLKGQTTIGINPDPDRYDGVLCQHRPERITELLAWLEGAESSFHIQRRIMAVAQREDGQRLLALNEVFIGHRTHQSARYRIRDASHPKPERQSSSGVICATGTGSTGWSTSIALQRGLANKLPQPELARLVWFVREPFPSVATGVKLDFGSIERDQTLELISEMGDGGVVFADGIESDFMEFLDGHSVRVTIAAQTLNLVVPGNQPSPSGSVPAVSRKSARPGYHATVTRSSRYTS